VLKSTSDQTLVESIRQVHQGKRLLSPTLVDKVLLEFQSMGNVRARQESGLSEHELRVVELMAQGKTNRDIARETCWSDRTIKRKVEDIMAKLGARNRAHVVAEATRRGLKKPTCVSWTATIPLPVVVSRPEMSIGSSPPGGTLCERGFFSSLLGSLCMRTGRQSGTRSGGGVLSHLETGFLFWPFWATEWHQFP
jgi:DNA-binding CsgD family transcriptional regulator